MHAEHVFVGLLNVHRRDAPRSETMSPAEDDGCDPDEAPAPTPPCVREPHRSPKVLTSFFTEDLYLRTYSTWLFQFSQCHPQRSTHGV